MWHDVKNRNIMEVIKYLKRYYRRYNSQLFTSLLADDQWINIICFGEWGISMGILGNILQMAEDKPVNYMHVSCELSNLVPRMFKTPF